MKSNYYIQKNKLIIDDTKEIVFDFPIQESVEIEDMLIVRIGLYDKVAPLEENIFGVSLAEKKIKWQIEKREYPTRGNPSMLCPFVGIRFYDNKLRLFNWCSTAFVVDPLTGKVLEQEQTR